MMTLGMVLEGLYLDDAVCISPSPLGCDSVKVGDLLEQARTASTCPTKAVGRV